RSPDAPPFRLLTVQGRLTLEGVSIVGGDASDTSCACGGGILSDGFLTIIDSRIAMNQSSVSVGPNQNRGHGGGIAANGPLLVIHSLVSLNRSATEGGGIRATAAAIIQGSTIADNTGQDGGGIAASTLTVNDSAITGNSGRFGGGIRIGGNLSVTNTTIT